MTTDHAPSPKRLTPPPQLRHSREGGWRVGDWPLATVFLSLGSNLGERQANVAEAVKRLLELGLNVTARSPIYETEAVDVGDQPDFLNQVIQVETSFSPFALLRAVKQIELGMGRPLVALGKPRVIDIDILLYDDLWVVAPDLVIPHSRMWARKFVLLPLLEFGLDPVSPSGEPASELLKRRGVACQVIARLPG